MADRAADFRERYLAQLKSFYPNAMAEIAAGRAAISQSLLSPNVVPVARRTLRLASEIVEAFDRLRESRAYVDEICARSPYPSAADPGNRAALTSFDFHSTEDGGLKLIEINTNASMGAMADLSYRAQGLANPFGSDFRADVVETFRQEARASRLGRDPQSIAIVDRGPEAQRLYVEFLLYRDLFEQNGIRCAIGDTSSLKTAEGRAALDGFEADAVYCRDVDFYFSAPESAGLKAAFESGAACVTPNPFEYQLLADKERLTELQASGFLEKALPSGAREDKAREAIRSCILRSRPMDSFDPDELWSERKNWFFKPARAYGGRAAYRGSSISKKTFLGLLGAGMIAQEYAPPPTLELPNPSGELEEYKYDLRFFVYRGRIQLGLARLYQGQMTNAQTPGGGSACLVPRSE